MPSAVTFSPDGHMLAIGYKDKSVKLWRIKEKPE